MRYLCFIILLLAAAHGSSAQSVPADTPSTALPRPPRLADADTIRAIRHLYARRRGWGLAIWGGGTAACLAAGGIVAERNKYSGYYLDTPGMYIGLSLIAASVPIGVGGYISGGYGARHEARLIQRYENGEPLPRRIRRQLKARHFVP
ncbi:hypothetical protein EJV47_09890 [Hymenobacter gummosus]|uniref:Uncharacterized protein n=1 Tax=Hymenobacter gummosus TaxID=1776032 RepID=A0A3S0JBJ5_9BACT|nr:hypothetical protein [Hymenobacter gummosus]RTQ50914.1 hypothetical protein EJV47_09890 [Hymenobacter gummosus]